MSEKVEVTRSIGLQERIRGAVESITEHQYWIATVMQFDEEEERYLTNEEIATQLVGESLTLGVFDSKYHQNNLDSENSRFTNYQEAREQDISNTKDLIIEIRGKFVAQDEIRERVKFIHLNNLDHQSFFNPAFEKRDVLIAYACNLYQREGEDYLTYEQIAGELNSKFGNKNGSDWISGSSMSLWFSRNREQLNLPYRTFPRTKTTPTILFDLEEGEYQFNTFIDVANTLFSTDQDSVLSLDQIVERLNCEFDLNMTPRSFMAWRYINRELVPINPDYQRIRAREARERLEQITDEMLMMFDRTFGSGEYTIKQAWKMIVDEFNIENPIAAKTVHIKFMKELRSAAENDPRFIYRREKDTREAQEVESIKEWLSNNEDTDIKDKVRYLQTQHGLSGHVILRHLGFDENKPDQDFTLFGKNIKSFPGARNTINRGRFLNEPTDENGG